MSFSPDKFHHSLVELVNKAQEYNIRALEDEKILDKLVSQRQPGL